MWFKTSTVFIFWILLVLYIFLESKIITSLRLGANFSELVGPNRTIIGTLAILIICIIPLSIDIAFSSLEDKAVTRAGPDNLDSCSGNNAWGISNLILLEIPLLSFSKKKTGVFLIVWIFFAKSIKFFKDQLFFLYSFPCVIEKPI